MNALAALLQILESNAPETQVVLLRQRVGDFGAIIATSREVFARAIGIVDEKDYNYFNIITPDERSGMALRVRKNPDAYPYDDDAPQVYEFEVWGDWVSVLESSNVTE